MLIKSGQEEKAIKSLYQTAWPKIKQYIMSHSGNREQAEDIFHDVIVKFMVKLRKEEFTESDDLIGYLFVMARNLWMTTVGRNAKVRLVDKIIDRRDLTKEDKSLELADMVDGILNGLGDICRDLLKLTYFEKAPLKEAAEKVGLSSADVARTYHYRCKKKLLEEVQGNELLKELLYN